MARQSERDSYVELRQQYHAKIMEMHKNPDYNKAMKLVSTNFSGHNDLKWLVRKVRCGMTEEQAVAYRAEHGLDRESFNKHQKEYVPTQDDFLLVLATYNEDGRHRNRLDTDWKPGVGEMMGVWSCMAMKTRSIAEREYGLKMVTEPGTTMGDHGVILPKDRRYLVDKEGRKISGGDIYEYMAMRIKEDPNFEIHPDIVHVQNCYNNVWKAFINPSIHLQDSKPEWLLGKAAFINELMHPNLEAFVPWITGPREIPHIKGIRSYT